MQHTLLLGEMVDALEPSYSYPVAHTCLAPPSVVAAHVGMYCVVVEEGGVLVLSVLDFQYLKCSTTSVGIVPDEPLYAD